MSEFQERLQTLSLADELNERLELSAAIDAEMTAKEGQYAGWEIDKAALETERDAWKKKYADRFYDPGEGETGKEKIDSRHKKDTETEFRKLGTESLWESKEK